MCISIQLTSIQCEFFFPIHLVLLLHFSSVGLFSLFPFSPRREEELIFPHTIDAFSKLAAFQVVYLPTTTKPLTPQWRSSTAIECSLQQSLATFKRSYFLLKSCLFLLIYLTIFFCLCVQLVVLL